MSNMKRLCMLGLLNHRGGWGYSDRFLHIFCHTDCTVLQHSIEQKMSTNRFLT